MQYKQRHTRTLIPLDRPIPIRVGPIGETTLTGNSSLGGSVAESSRIGSAFTESNDPEVTMRFEDKMIRHSRKIIGNNPGSTLQGSLCGIT